MPHTYIERKRSTGLPHFFFLFSSSTHILSKQTGGESSRRRSAATVPMWRSAGVTAVLHSSEARGWRPVARARARGGGGVGHDNDIDDDDGELTFLLCSVELSPTYTVVHGARRHTAWRLPSSAT